jgi:hypothetical protein
MEKVGRLSYRDIIVERGRLCKGKSRDGENSR